MIERARAISCAVSIWCLQTYHDLKNKGRYVALININSFLWELSHALQNPLPLMPGRSFCFSTLQPRRDRMNLARGNTHRYYRVASNPRSGVRNDTVLQLPEFRALSTLTPDGRLLFLTRMLRLFAYGLLAVILGLYLAEMGLTDTQIGLLLSLTLLG